MNSGSAIEERSRRRRQALLRPRTFSGRTRRTRMVRRCKGTLQAHNTSIGDWWAARAARRKFTAATSAASAGMRLRPRADAAAAAVAALSACRNKLFVVTYRCPVGVAVHLPARARLPWRADHCARLAAARYVRSNNVFYFTDRVARRTLPLACPDPRPTRRSCSATPTSCCRWGGPKQVSRTEEVYAATRAHRGRGAQPERLGSRRGRTATPPSVRAAWGRATARSCWWPRCLSTGNLVGRVPRWSTSSTSVRAVPQRPRHRRGVPRVLPRVLAHRAGSIRAGRADQALPRAAADVGVGARLGHQL